MNLKKLLWVYYLKPIFSLLILVPLLFVLPQKIDLTHDIPFSLKVIVLVYLIFKSISVLKDKKEIDTLFEKNGKFYKDELNKVIFQTKGKEILIFTENLAFLIGNNVEICSYDKILLMHKKTRLEKYGGVVKCLFLLTKKACYKIYLYHPQSNLSNEKIASELENLLISKNPNILVGKTVENKKLLKEKYGFKKFWILYLYCW